MNQFTETEVTEVRSAPSAGAENVTERRTQVVEGATSSKITAINIVWYIFGFISTLLALRFILKLLGANPGSGFVSFIYTLSSILSAPFDTIFGVATTQAGQTRSVFEPSILVAIAVYALIAWGITKLIRINEVR